MRARGLVLGLLLAGAGCLSKPAAPDDRADGGTGSDAGPGSDAAIDASILPAAFLEVAVGSQHACTRQGSNLYCWGDNDRDQVNSSDAGSVPTPTLVGRTGWTSIAASGAHTCGVAGGDVYCWGNDTEHESSGTTGSDEANDKQVTLTAGAGSAVRVFAGDDGSCAIDTGGQLFCWGNIAGHDDVVTQLMPGGIATGWGEVALGADHACATTATDGKVYCWGNNSHHQLGVGQTSSSIAVGSAHPKPAPGDPSSDDTLSSVTVNDELSCGIRGGSAIVCWGTDHEGRLNAGNGGTADMTITTGPTGHAWIGVALGFENACATDSTGGVYCWGDDDFGGRGDGLDPPADGGFTAGKIIETDGTARQLGLGSGTGCAIDANHQVRCWGADDFGEVGRGYAASTTIPQQVDLGGGSAALIAVGNKLACAAIGSAGANEVKCWGDNTQQEITSGSAQLIPTPTETAALETNSVSSLSAGDDHMCAEAGGSAVCWGANTYDQLFSLNATAHTTGLSASYVRAHEETSCYEAGSDITCWGQIPTDDSGNTGSMKYSATAWAAYAVGSNVLVGATATGIGAGSAQEIGYDLLARTTRIPTATTELTGPSGNTAMTFAIGDDHACAGFTGGGSDPEIICWGDNGYGQLAESTTVTSGSNTVAPPSGDTWLATEGTVAASSNHACAVTTGQKLVCWGDNFYDELADNFDNAPEEVAPPTGLGWLAVSTSDFDTCAIATDHSVWCWGYNEFGEVGDGHSFAGTPQPIVLDPP